MQIVLNQIQTDKLKMKVLILLILTSVAMGYKITWLCGLCGDTYNNTICYNIQGDPFGNAIIPVDGNITTCDQTGLSFPRYYEFSSCGDAGCKVSFSLDWMASTSCINSQNYLPSSHVDDLTAVYKLFKGDQGATYDWCQDFIVPVPVPEDSNTGLIVGVVVGVVVVVGAIVGGIFYFKKKKASQSDYQVQV